MLELALALVGSYIIGSIPTGYLIVRWVKRVDVRQHGSGNVGATNVGRVAGKKLSAVVFVLDISKGLIAAWPIASLALGTPSIDMRLLCGTMAVVGHSFPIFLRLGGGKGVATTIGALLAVMPIVGLIFIGIWICCAWIWRYVSVASITAAVSIPIAQVVMGQDVIAVMVGACLCLLVVVRHHDNIRRLARGQEPKIGS